MKTTQSPKQWKYLLISHLITPLFHLIIRAYSLTYRYKIINAEKWEKQLADGEIILLAGWHQQFLPLIHPFHKYKKYHPCLLISQSKDGDIIADVAKKSHWTPIRGSSSRGGASGLKNMVKAMKTFRLGAHIVDGPKGPMGTIKLGLIQLAISSGATIIPFYVDSSNSRYLSSWDRFMIPKAFSHVTITYGDGIKIPENCNHLQNECNRIEKIMQPYLHLKEANTIPAS